MSNAKELRWYSSGSGRIEFQMTLEQAGSVSQPGKDASEDVTELRKDPTIESQLAAINPDVLRAELKEYGAWDKTELADHDANLNRILWIAGGAICEEEYLKSRDAN